MDREIKFRAWDEERGEFWYSDDGRGFRFIISPKGGCYVEKLSSDETITEGPWSQFTGLKDKNGKEIYEGDILRIHNYKQTWKREEPPIDWRVFEVQWNRYTFYLNNEYIGAPLADYDVNDLEPWDIEVIGNIYENTELIK